MKSLIAFVFIFICINSYASTLKLEAEDASLSGVNIKTSINSFSGTGYVDDFDNDGDKVEFKFNWDKNGKYQLTIGYAATHGDKKNTLIVNGENAVELLFSKTSTFKELDAGKIELINGENTIRIEKSWGWFQVDYIQISDASESIEWNIAPTPVNPQISSEAKALYTYLRESFGRTTFSGQYMNDNFLYDSPNSEIQFVKNVSGKYPAIYGSDLMNFSPSRVERGAETNVLEDLINYSEEEGGIITLSWHWNAPTDLYDTDENPWWSGFYTKATSFDIEATLNNPESENYDLIIRDIDAIAEKLKIIEQANIPILWRPLHEAEGKWFWWGAKGPQPCVELWKLLYERLTNYHLINNLLWVWTTTDNASALDWYPGDNYVDILGADIYLDDGIYSSSANQFDKIRNLYQGKKLVSMSENGPIPDPTKMFEQDAPWLYFCTWSGEFITGGKKNSTTHINEVFNHDKITSADELKDYVNLYVAVNSENEASESIDIFPNPFINELNIRQNNSNIRQAELLNNIGQKVFDIPITTNNMIQSINTSQLNKGIYLLHLTYNNHSEINKVIKR